MIEVIAVGPTTWPVSPDSRTSTPAGTGHAAAAMTKDEITLSEIRRRERLQAILEKERAKDAIQARTAPSHASPGSGPCAETTRSTLPRL